jgi:L,D-peptidoglycan transpeptidase YkuD (ErfK/YbiS/YcfS/YnhG family)
MAIYTASLSRGSLSGPSFEAPCVFGKAGLVSAEGKREGDGASPIGVWPVRRVFYRADRLDAPETRLRLDPVMNEDGWCDAPDDPAYNRMVKRPYEASHEALVRDDGLYDLIVVLGHNDDPPVQGLGSAIFLHCRPDHDRGTLGCVAIPQTDLVRLVEALAPGDSIEICA